MVFPMGEHGDSQLRILEPIGPHVLIASVQYSLAPQYQCPAAPTDVFRAMTWLHKHAATVGGDANAMSVLGVSAGANLAAVAALHAASRGLHLQFAGIFYPMIFNSLESESYRLFDGGGLNSTSMGFFWRSYCEPHACDGDWRCTPLSATDLPALAQVHAPSLVVSCDSDVLRDDAVQYYDALRVAGAAVGHLALPGGHGCIHHSAHRLFTAMEKHWTWLHSLNAAAEKVGMPLRPRKRIRRG